MLQTRKGRKAQPLDTVLPESSIRFSNKSLHREPSVPYQNLGPQIDRNLRKKMFSPKCSKDIIWALEGPEQGLGTYKTSAKI